MKLQVFRFHSQMHLVKRWQVRDIDETVVAGGNEKVNRLFT
jgi:hypothetical protein